jgi:branched-chain amino acid transport system substrate-binding protein
MIIAQAIKEAGKTDGESLISALENISYTGALGTITFPVNRANPPDKAGKEDKWWHQFPDPAITIVQYQEVNKDSTESPVVFPDKYKTGEPVFVNQ